MARRKQDVGRKTEDVGADKSGDIEQVKTVNVIDDQVQNPGQEPDNVEDKTADKQDDEQTLVGCLIDAGAMVEMDEDGNWIPSSEDEKHLAVELVEHLSRLILGEEGNPLPAVGDLPPAPQGAGFENNAIAIPWPAALLGLIGISQHHDMPFRTQLQTLTDLEGNFYTVDLNQVNNGRFEIEVRVEFGKMAYSQMLDRQAQIERKTGQLLNQIKLIKSADGYETSQSELGIQRREDVAQREAELRTLEAENVAVEIDEPNVETYRFPVDGSVKVFVSGAVRL